MRKITYLLKQVLIVLAIPAIVYILAALAKPGIFLSFSTVYSVCLQSCIVCILAWGISFSQTAGIVDFSIAAERILGSVIGVLLSRKMGLPGLILGCMSVSLICGFIKGILNSMIKMSSMVISVAYTFVLGAIGAIVQGTYSMILTSEICIMGKAPMIWVVLVGSGIVVYILQRYSVFGSNCRALGGSNKLAQESGIAKGRIEGKAIFIASIFAGISGVVATSYGAGTAAITGLESMSIVFPAIIGFNIGRILEKYINITIGCAAGVVTMNILATALVSLGIPSQLKDTVTGAFLLVLMILTAFLEKKRKEALRRQARDMSALSIT